MANTYAVVSALPKCNFCEQRARYDSNTVYGSWAYFCNDCYKSNPIHFNALGQAYGQYLVLDTEEVPEHAKRH